MTVRSRERVVLPSKPTLFTDALQKVKLDSIKDPTLKQIVLEWKKELMHKQKLRQEVQQSAPLPSVAKSRRIREKEKRQEKTILKHLNVIEQFKLPTYKGKSPSVVKSARKSGKAVYDVYILKDMGIDSKDLDIIEKELWGRTYNNLHPATRLKRINKYNKFNKLVETILKTE